jgi:hypothetical protein
MERFAFGCVIWEGGEIQHFEEVFDLDIRIYGVLGCLRIIIFIFVVLFSDGRLSEIFVKNDVIYHNAGVS